MPILTIDGSAGQDIDLFSQLYITFYRHPQTLDQIIVSQSLLPNKFGQIFVPRLSGRRRTKYIGSQSDAGESGKPVNETPTATEMALCSIAGTKITV